jgi:hypothetical protein
MFLEPITTTHEWALFTYYQQQKTNIAFFEKTIFNNNDRALFFSNFAQHHISRVDM